jgi:hypothetical protein
VPEIAAHCGHATISRSTPAGQYLDKLSCPDRRTGQPVGGEGDARTFYRGQKQRFRIVGYERTSGSDRLSFTLFAKGPIRPSRDRLFRPVCKVLAANAFD